VRQIRQRRTGSETVIYIAIDPGLTGAIAAIDDEAQLVLCACLIR
jgi:predicted RNase H-like nuclease (RuvC/YqgF family)